MGHITKITDIWRGQPEGSACFCLNLFSTSVASNPALSHSCRGITCYTWCACLMSNFRPPTIYHMTRIKINTLMNFVKEAVCVKKLVGRNHMVQQRHAEGSSSTKIPINQRKTMIGLLKVKDLSSHHWLGKVWRAYHGRVGFFGSPSPFQSQVWLIKVHI